MSDERGETRRWLIVLSLALLLSLTLRIFVVSPYTVDGSSMLPSLVNGERLLVAKNSYRQALPARGAIVVFRCPRNPNEDYVKRVIALPGETVELRNGTVYINGNVLVEPYLGQVPASDFPPHQVESGMIFVLGDNRGHSDDSRYFGDVPLANIRGPVILRLWPIGRLGRPR
jgi:signal peptidase I